jgi:predicted lipid carrier protein YhbT
MNDKPDRLAPRLPGLLRLSLRHLPVSFPAHLFTQTLNKLFAEQLKDGELDFMASTVIEVNVEDAGLQLRLCLRGERFSVAEAARKADLTIAGSLYDFLLLAGRREDPDTLFFNRRLKLSGNTELGLYVKNFLDSMDLSGGLQWLQQASFQASRLAERLSLFKGGRVAPQRKPGPVE